jgi:hypothetical protein
VLSGTWTGDLLLGERDLREFQVTCHCYGMPDVTVYGGLEPEKR